MHRRRHPKGRMPPAQVVASRNTVRLSLREEAGFAGTLTPIPSPGRRECGWERGPGGIGANLAKPVIRLARSVTQLASAVTQLASAATRQASAAAGRFRADRRFLFPEPGAAVRALKMAARTIGLLRTDLSFPQILPASRQVKPWTGGLAREFYETRQYHPVGASPEDRWEVPPGQSPLAGR